MRHIPLARSPEEPQFGVALLKLVIELRQDPIATLEDAMVRALRGMRVDREAFHRHVTANRDRYLSAVGPRPRMRVTTRPVERRIRRMF